jgi:hypothetical protein
MTFESIQDLTSVSQRPSVAPILNMQQIAAQEHFVQFYERDDYLALSMSAFLAQGISAGDAGVVIATRDHRAAVEEKLNESGINMTDARKNGLYSSYDAAGLLSRLLIAGQPDHRRVRAALGPIIERAQACSPSGVRIFGEMVALLWAEGNKVAAIELEILWNELAERYSFTLMCAYPITAFSDDEKSNQLRHICRAHSRVIPHESYSSLFAQSSPRGA